MKTHISLNVSNVKESIEFYKKMFGTAPFKVKSDYAKFDIENPLLNLAMNQVKFEKGGSLSHLGLQVETTKEVLAIGKRWTENGLLTLDEMQTDCCYAFQDKIWVSDPDGNSWEVFTVLDNIETKKDSVSACCLPTQNLANIIKSEKAACC
jgi:predicted lactoylglutathione lyase